MKELKPLALAVFIATALVALIGAASASATVLCAGEGTASRACPAGPHEDEFSGEIKATSTNATLKTSIATMVCSTSSMTIEPESATGSPAVAAQVTALSFGPSCHLTNGAETACTVTVNNLPYTVSLEGEVGGEPSKSTLAVSGMSWKAVCGLLINCTYSKKSISLEGSNGEPTTFAAKEVEMERAGGLCPASGTWSATYSVTTPKSGMTVHGPGAAVPTVICAGEGTPSESCPSGGHGDEYGGGIEANAVDAVLVTSIAAMICPEAGVTIQPESAKGSPALGAEVSAMGFGPGCHLNDAAQTSCTVTSNGLPYSAQIESEVGGEVSQSSVAISGTSWTVKCGALISCTYSKGTLPLVGSNGSPTAFAIEAVELERSGSICPSLAILSATYAVSSPAGGVTVHGRNTSSPTTTLICAGEGAPSEACPAGPHEDEYAGPIEAGTTTATLVTSVATIVCPEGSFTLQPKGTPAVSVKVTAMTLGPGCHLNNEKETACTVTINNLPYSATLVAGEAGESSLSVAGTSWQAACGAIIVCTFSAKSMPFVGTNGTPTTFAAKEVAMERTGGLCPATSKWTATYSVTAPEGGVTIGP